MEEIVENKMREMADLIKSDYNTVCAYVREMMDVGYDNEEVIIILDYFMNGGMLSEIIAPPKSRKVHDPVLALQEFDRFFCTQRNKIPGLNDKLFMQWAVARNKKN